MINVNARTSSVSIEPPASSTASGLVRLLRPFSLAPCGPHPALSRRRGSAAVCSAPFAPRCEKEGRVRFLDSPLIEALSDARRRMRVVGPMSRSQPGIPSVDRWTDSSQR
jgi:hypothetical protein